MDTSSTHSPKRGHQSLISIPLWPRLPKPTCNGSSVIMSCRSVAVNCTTFFFTKGEFNTSLCGVSEIDLPTYWLIAGVGSKDSRWLRPPWRKIQITLLALGGKCGLPSGGDHSLPVVAANPSRCNIAPSARPTKPMPQSARNIRRLTRPQEHTPNGFVTRLPPSSNRHEFTPVEERVDKVFARSQFGLSDRCLTLEEVHAAGQLHRGRRPSQDRLIRLSQEQIRRPVRASDPLRQQARLRQA